MSGLACRNRKGGRGANFHSPLPSHEDWMRGAPKVGDQRSPHLLVASGASTTLFGNDALPVRLVFPA